MGDQNKKMYSLYKCPFCGEKTLVANKELDAYACFSCRRTGRLSKSTDAAGTQEQAAVDDAFYDINEAAATYYYLSLRGDNEGSHYFAKRKITQEQIDEFGLGYAPAGYHNLYDHLKKRFSDEDLMRSGLFREGKYGMYDFFRDRVMFPIFDEKERVVGFGGRVLDDSKPKYLNSSENTAFSKRRLLYGYPYTEKPKSDMIFICEGYMDLIAVKKAGIRDSAAVLGTALTPEHVKTIAKRYKKVCLGFDSDEAGMNAIKKSVAELKAYGLTVTVPSFKPAKDPDELLRDFGRDALIARIVNAEPAERFIAEHGTVAELLDVLVDHG